MIQFNKENRSILVTILLYSQSSNPKAQSISCTYDTFNSCCGGCGYSFTSNEELRQAVEHFQTDAAAATTKYGILNCWDVSRITDVNHLFAEHDMNEPIDCWDVRKVNNIQGLFAGTARFNQPLTSWNTSGVTKMVSLFYNAKSFNQPLSSWDVSSVNDMAWMFFNASSFNQPLDSWSTTRVTNMSLMFYEATSFDQPIENWDVGSVVDMQKMFFGATSFNHSLSSWDIGNVINMDAMFNGASSFNQSLCLWYEKISLDPFPAVIDMFSNSNCAEKSNPDFGTKLSFCDTCIIPVSSHIILLTISNMIHPA